MFQKCPLCGKRSLWLGRRSTKCPKCGTSVPSDKEGLDLPEGSRDAAFGFPVRATDSLEDQLKKEWQEQFGMGQTKGSTISKSWDTVFDDRPLDMPFYTALNGRACILIYMSSQSVPSHEAVADVLEGRFPPALQSEMVLPASYPIVWCAFVFPDDFRNPLILETWMDVLEGNFQDFCTATAQDEHVDLLIKHKSAPTQLISVACQATGLASMLKREVSRATEALPSDAVRKDFVESVAAIEEMPNTESLRVHLSKATTLTPCAKAKNQSILYR